MKMKSFTDLFIHQIQDLQSAEEQIIEALPKMVETADDPQLREAFSNHLKETKEQLKRVKQILTEMNESGGEKCKAVEGLIKEGSEMIKAKVPDPAIRDAGMIASAQRIEHYEISAYGTARHFAELLGNNRAARLLEETLMEEEAADQKLNQIAKSHVNLDAMNQADRQSRSPRSRSAASHRKSKSTHKASHARSHH